MRKIFMSSLFLFVLIGCATHTNFAPPMEEKSSFLEGQNWKIEKIVLKGKELSIKTTEEVPNIHFEKDKFYGYAGCNRFFGNYQNNNDVVQVDGAASTQMLCQPRVLMDFETALLTNFKGDFKLSNENGKIRLENQDLIIYLQ